MDHPQAVHRARQCRFFSDEANIVSLARDSGESWVNFYSLYGEHWQFMGFTFVLLRDIRGMGFDLDLSVIFVGSLMGNFMQIQWDHLHDHFADTADPVFLAKNTFANGQKPGKGQVNGLQIMCV